MQSGRQQKLTDAFLKDALVPALNRLGIASVGVFNLTIGPVTPTFYVLMAAASVETLTTSEARLGQDAEYLKAGAPFLTAPADEPPLIRIESSLMVAFEGWPKLKLPAATAEHKERIFELRTYESPSDQDHRHKPKPKRVPRVELEDEHENEHPDDRLEGRPGNVGREYRFIGGS